MTSRSSTAARRECFGGSAAAIRASASSSVTASDATSTVFAPMRGRARSYCRAISPRRSSCNERRVRAAERQPLAQRIQFDAPARDDRVERLALPCAQLQPVDLAGIDERVHRRLRLALEPRRQHQRHRIENRRQVVRGDPLRQRDAIGIEQRPLADDRADRTDLLRLGEHRRRVRLDDHACSDVLRMIQSPCALPESRERVRC